MTQTHSIPLIEVSQSAFMSAHEDYLAANNTGQAHKPFNEAAVPRERMPKDWKKFVVWGLGGTLLNYSEDVYGVLCNRSIDGLRKCKVNLPELDAAEARVAAIKKRLDSDLSEAEKNFEQATLPIHEKAVEQARSDIFALAEKSLKEKGTPSKYLAEKYKIPENILLIETMSAAILQDFGTHPANFGTSDQSDLNLLEDSRDLGIHHAVITSGTSGFARFVLNFRAIAPLCAYIGGTDIIHLPNDEVADKKIHAAQWLRTVLKDDLKIPDDRMKDVLVVDHTPEWLEAARDLGTTSVYMGSSKKAQTDVATRFDHATSDIRGVLEGILGVPFHDESRKDIMSRAELHIPAGSLLPTL